MLYNYSWSENQRQKNCSIVRVVTEGATSTLSAFFWFRYQIFPHLLAATTTGKLLILLCLNNHVIKQLSQFFCYHYLRSEHRKEFLYNT